MISFGTKVLMFDLKNIEQTQISVADNKNKTVYIASEKLT